MKAIKIIGSFLFISSLLFSCQNENKNLIEVKIIEKDGHKNIAYLPNLEFRVVIDSAKYLFDDKDYYRLLTSDIKVAPPIFQNDSIKVRVFTRKQIAENEQGFLVRTYTMDGNIKDEIVLASTFGDLSCEGKVTSDLRVITTCPGGEEKIAQIEKDGSIKIIENE